MNPHQSTKQQPGNEFISYNLHGTDMQVVELDIPPGTSIIAEPGALNYMEDGIQFESKLSDGSEQGSGIIGKIVSLGKRMMSGEKAFVTHFTNQSSTNARAGFSSHYPGNIIAINLSENYGQVYAVKESFLAGMPGVHISVAMTKKIQAGLFAGDGFILQKLIGENMVFLNAGGTVVRHRLLDETLRIETGSLVAFTRDINYNVEMLSPKNAMFGGKGIFMATLKGTGTVWTQSMPFNRLVENIYNKIPFDFTRIDKIEKKLDKIKKKTSSGMLGM